MFGKVKEKIIALVLASSLSSGPVIGQVRTDRYFIVGTPEQIENAIANNEGNIFGRKSFDAIKDTEVMEEIWFEQDATLNISFNFSFSPDYNQTNINADYSGVKKHVHDQLEPQLAKFYADAFYKFERELESKVNGARPYSHEQLKEMFWRAMTRDNITVLVDIKGFSCPMGGNVEKNKQLSEVRANSAKSIVARAVRECLEEAGFGVETLSIRAEGGGMITSEADIYDNIDDDAIIGHALSEIDKEMQKTNKDFKLDHSKFRNKDTPELAKFNNALLSIRQKNPNKYDEIKKIMDPLRRVSGTVKMKLKVFFADMKIKVVEKHPMPFVAPEKQKLKFQKVSHDVKETIRRYEGRRPQIKKNRPRMNPASGRRNAI